jgi:hypothetical protein
VVFEAPLRVRARLARGSDLLDRRTLRQLLSWPVNQPDLAVVLVDQDGEPTRKLTLQAHLSAAPPLPVQRVVGVAVEEFEAWLISDMDAVRMVLGGDLAEPRSPEKLEPRAAKQLLRGWISASRRDEPLIRSDIAKTCSWARSRRILDHSRRSSRTFDMPVDSTQDGGHRDPEQR